MCVCVCFVFDSCMNIQRQQFWLNCTGPLSGCSWSETEEGKNILLNINLNIIFPSFPVCPAVCLAKQGIKGFTRCSFVFLFHCKTDQSHLAKGEGCCKLLLSFLPSSFYWLCSRKNISTRKCWCRKSPDAASWGWKWILNKIFHSTNEIIYKVTFTFYFQPVFCYGKPEKVLNSLVTLHTSFNKCHLRTHLSQCRSRAPFLLWINQVHLCKGISFTQAILGEDRF